MASPGIFPAREPARRRTLAPVPAAGYIALVKTALVLLVALLAQAAGNTLLSRAMKAIGAGGGDVVVRGLQTPLVWLGILLGLVFFALFLATLSWEDLSVILPLSSFGYVLNVAFAHWFLHEPVSATRWAGTVLVMVGVALVARTARGPARPTTTPPPAPAAPGAAEEPRP